MSDKIKKKNLNTRKGTQRWRKNIDLTEIEDALIKKTNESVQEKITKNLKTNNKIAFKIDITSHEQNNKLKQPLHINRFHKKEVDECLLSKKEQLKIKKLKDKIIKKQIQLNPQHSKQEEGEEIIQDIWSTQQDKSIDRNIQKSKVRHVILPSSGQSYNPCYKDHQKVIQQAIEMEDEELKQKLFLEKKAEMRKLKDQKLSQKMEESKKLQKMTKEQKEKKEERQKEHQKHIIKKAKKELKTEQEKVEENVKIKSQKKQFFEELKQNTGLNLKPERIGIKKFIQKGPDFLLEEDLPDNLRNIQPAGNLLRDEYQAIFRKGLIEAKNIFRKDKKSRIKSIKYKQKYDPYFNNNWDNDEKELDIKN